MRKARRFISREKQAFLVGFSLHFRDSREYQNRVNNSLYLPWEGKWVKKCLSNMFLKVEIIP